MNNNDLIEDDISKAFRDVDRLTRILQEGIYDALRQHKRAGNPICVWRDNKVVWIPPDQIPVKDK